MEFTLDAEQIALQEAVAGLLKNYDPEHRRQVIATDPGFETSQWQQFAEMGLLGLPFSEADGGMGAGPIEVGVTATEIGKALAPEPYVAVVVMAGGLVAAAGTEDQRAELLGGLAAGEKMLAYASGDLSLSDDKISGVAEVVIAGGIADNIIVLAENKLFVVAGADTERTSFRTHDGAWAARIVFNNTPAQLLGTGDASCLPLVTAAAQIGYCNEAIGAMETALKMTTEYLTTRKQFGVTLNRFQALTFRAADCYVQLELSKSVVGWATMVLDEGEAEDAIEAATRAKLQIGKAQRLIGQEAIQLHGGIGMTSEYAIGHYTSRLEAINHQLGDINTQLQKLLVNVGNYQQLDLLD